MEMHYVNIGLYVNVKRKKKDKGYYSDSIQEENMS